MTIRRLKTYTGSLGYVYQYYFVGKRPAAISNDAQPQAQAHEYIFDVTSDRQHTYSVSILLSASVVAAWGDSHGRALSDSEQYAAVKMRLFRAFDEIEDLRAQGRELQVEQDFLEQSLRALGVE